MRDAYIKEMCQCPVSGYPHFYWTGNHQHRRWEDVSMPCLGLSPFLLRLPEIKPQEKGGVSMPCLGLSPFLLMPRIRESPTG